MPDLFLKLNELIKESDFETAKELHNMRSMMSFIKWSVVEQIFMQ